LEESTSWFPNTILVFSAIGSIKSNQHLALPLYDRSPRAKTNSGSCLIILSTVSSVSEVQSQSPTATKLKIDFTLLLFSDSGSFVSLEF